MAPYSSALPNLCQPPMSLMTFKINMQTVYAKIMSSELERCSFRRKLCNLAISEKCAFQCLCLFYVAERVESHLLAENACQCRCLCNVRAGGIESQWIILIDALLNKGHHLAWRVKEWCVQSGPPLAALSHIQHIHQPAAVAVAHQVPQGSIRIHPHGEAAYC